jgi:hypothetical protein
MGVNFPGSLFSVPGTKGAKTKHRIPQKSSANPDNLRNFRRKKNFSFRTGKAHSIAKLLQVVTPPHQVH